MTIQISTDPALNELHRQFLEIWPTKRVREMKLDDYVVGGHDDTFCRWLEQKTQDLGSIWGGSAFKFGVFRRKNSNSKESKTHCYDENYGWLRKLGNTPEEAFKKTRQSIIAILDAIESGDIEKIAKIQLGPVLKRKIAFMYQNLERPCALNIFNEKWMLRYLKMPQDGKKISVWKLYAKLLEVKPEGMGLCEFGNLIKDSEIPTGSLKGFIEKLILGNTTAQRLQTRQESEKSSLQLITSNLGTMSREQIKEFLLKICTETNFNVKVIKTRFGLGLSSSAALKNIVESKDKFNDWTRRFWELDIENVRISL